MGHTEPKSWGEETQMEAESGEALTEGRRGRELLDARKWQTGQRRREGLGDRL